MKDMFAEFQHTADLSFIYRPLLRACVLRVGKHTSGLLHAAICCASFVRTHHRMPHMLQVNEHLQQSERTTNPLVKARRSDSTRPWPVVCLEWQLQVFPLIPTALSFSNTWSAAALESTDDEYPSILLLSLFILRKH